MGQGIISRSNPGNTGDKVGDIKITTRNTLGDKWALCNGAICNHDIATRLGMAELDPFNENNLIIDYAPIMETEYNYRSLSVYDENTIYDAYFNKNSGQLKCTIYQHTGNGLFELSSTKVYEGYIRSNLILESNPYEPDCIIFASKYCRAIFVITKRLFADSDNYYSTIDSIDIETSSISEGCNFLTSSTLDINGNYASVSIDIDKYGLIMGVSKTLDDSDALTYFRYVKTYIYNINLKKIEAEEFYYFTGNMDSEDTLDDHINIYPNSSVLLYSSYNFNPPIIGGLDRYVSADTFERIYFYDATGSKMDGNTLFVYGENGNFIMLPESGISISGYRKNITHYIYTENEIYSISDNNITMGTPIDISISLDYYVKGYQFITGVVIIDDQIYLIMQLRGISNDGITTDKSYDIRYFKVIDKQSYSWTATEIDIDNNPEICAFLFSNYNQVISSDNYYYGIDGQKICTHTLPEISVDDESYCFIKIKD